MANRALIVGINDYEGTANDLPSCVKDTLQFESLLRGDPYKFTDIQILHDSKATIQAVEEGFKALLKDAKSGDNLVFFYSGHGYSSPKNDILEEYLVFYDGLFQDDRLSALTQNLADGVLLTVVLDSCFSGGMEKRVFNLVDGDRAKVKTWMPPRDVLERDLEAEKNVKGYKAFCSAPVSTPTLASPKEFRRKAQSDESNQLQMKGLLLAACLETETAGASTSQTNGMSGFTFCFLDALASKGPGCPLTDLLQATTAKLRSLGFGQTPVLKAPVASASLGAGPFLSVSPSVPGPQPVDPGSNGHVDAATIAAIVAAVLSLQPKSAIPPADSSQSKRWDALVRLAVQIVGAVVASKN